MKHLSLSDRERLADLIVSSNGTHLYSRTEIKVRIVKVLGRLQNQDFRKPAVNSAACAKTEEIKMRSFQQ